MAIAILLVVVACLVMPVQVLAYKENMFELVVGGDPGLIVQNQSYSTSATQKLFHTADNVLTDNEAFAFSGVKPTGIQLAQTTAATAVGTESGFFTSSASADIVPPVHIGNGFLGTWAGDPLWTGVPIFGGMTFPQMTPTDTSALASIPAGLSPAGSGTKSIATSNKSAAIPLAASQPGAMGTTGSKTQMDMALFSPITNFALNTTLANQSNAGKPSLTPSPAVPKGQVFYHQQNKPFSTDLTAPSGPFKATAASIQNTTGFNRFLMDTVGRSTTDKAFDGTTSSPTYIHPADALAVQIPYDFIQGARGMTMPGTHLNYRAWPL